MEKLRPPLDQYAHHTTIQFDVPAALAIGTELPGERVEE
jgi:hypothetical protein